MTRTVAIADNQARAKVRAPWIVAALSLVTLGIYQIYWWFAINRELRDLGHGRHIDLGERPALSALAFSVGSWLLVPYVWTVIATSGRIAEAERISGLATPHNAWLGSSLLIAGWVIAITACALAPAGAGLVGALLAGALLSVGGVAYMQNAVNRVWNAVGLDSSARPAVATA